MESILENFPSEILLQICQLLSLKEIGALSATSKHWNKKINSWEHFWWKKYNNDIAPTPQTFESSTDNEWKLTSSCNSRESYRTAWKNFKQEPGPGYSTVLHRLVMKGIIYNYSTFLEKIWKNFAKKRSRRSFENICIAIEERNALRLKETIFTPSFYPFEDLDVMDFIIQQGLHIQKISYDVMQYVLAMNVSEEKQMRILDFYVHKGAHLNGCFQLVLMSNNLKLLEYLIHHQFHINIPATFEHPIITAIKIKNFGGLKMLLYYGCQIPHRKAIEEVSENLCTHEYLELMLNYGLDIHSNPSALMSYVENCDSTSFEFLCSLNKLQWKIVDHEGKNFLHHIRNRFYRIPVLVAKGVNINGLDYEGNTPLHAAVRKKSIGTVEELLKNGANPNVVGVNGVSVLQVAINHRFQPAVQSLLKYGAVSTSVRS